MQVQLDPLVVMHFYSSKDKLMQELGGNVEAIGPILIGMKKPVHVLQLGSTVREIVNMIVIAVVDAQTSTKRNKTTSTSNKDKKAPILAK